MRILLADKLAPHVARELAADGHEVVVDPSLKDEALRERMAAVDPEVLVVRSTKVRVEHLDAAPSLALVIRAGAGTNTIAVAEASDRAIYVANCPGRNAIAVAELAMGHLVNCDRRIADNVADLRRHRWAKKAYGKARGLYGRTLAVLGTGRIGREVIARARAFGMRVRAWDIALTPELAEELGVVRCETALEACTGADALTIHLPLTEATRGLVGEELLRALNPGACVIHTARGGVLDEDAFLRVADERDLRAGLDVYANEPAATDEVFEDRIADSPRVYGTHHIGASTEQATRAVGDEVLRIVRAFVAEGRVLNCVNLETRPPSTHMLVVRHADRVGVLAGVLDLLREAGVNVQEMENKIFSGSRSAVARIQLSRAPSGEVMDQIAASPDVLATTLVALEA